MSLEQTDRPSKVNRADRPTRTPIHGKRDILGVKGMEAGFHYCWVNDDEHGNVERYFEGGYDFVTHDVIVGDKKINAASQVGGKVSKPVGNGLIAFLMRCPDDVYEAEMGAIHDEVDEKEAAMKANLNSKIDGRYGEVEIKSNKSLAPRGIGVRRP